MAHTKELFSPEARALINRQHGILAATQAATLDLPRETLRMRVSRGLWQRTLPGVYLLQCGPPNPIQRAVAAQVYAGDRSIITGPAALRLHGIGDAVSMLWDDLEGWAAWTSSNLAALNAFAHDESVFFTHSPAPAPEPAPSDCAGSELVTSAYALECATPEHAVSAYTASDDVTSNCAPSGIAESDRAVSASATNPAATASAVLRSFPAPRGERSPSTSPAATPSAAIPSAVASSAFEAAARAGIRPSGPESTPPPTMRASRPPRPGSPPPSARVVRAATSTSLPDTATFTNADTDANAPAWRIHLLLPHGQRRQNVAYVRISRTTRLPEPVRRHGLNLAPPARAVLDACSWCLETPDNVVADAFVDTVVRATVSSGLAELRDLEDELHQAPRRHTRSLRLGLARARIYERAAATRQLFDGLKRLGSGGPMLCAAVYGDRRRIAVVEAVWPSRALVVMVDPMPETVAELTRFGFAVVQISAGDMIRDAAEVAKRIAAALAGRPEANLPSGVALLPLGQSVPDVAEEEGLLGRLHLALATEPTLPPRPGPRARVPAFSGAF